MVVVCLTFQVDRPDAAGPDGPRTGPGLPPVPAWLDEIEGAEALAWVEARNAETLSAYRGGERFELMRRSFPRFGEAASITCFWRFSGIHSNWRKTSVALVPSKPKLLDSTVRRLAGREAVTSGSPCAAGSGFSTLILPAMKPCLSM